MLTHLLGGTTLQPTTAIKLAELFIQQALEQAREPRKQARPAQPARPGGGSQSRVARELRPFRSALLSPSNCTSEIHLRQVHLNADKQKTHIFICIQIYIHTEKRLEKDAAK